MFLTHHDHLLPLVNEVFGADGTSFDWNGKRCRHETAFLGAPRNPSMGKNGPVGLAGQTFSAYSTCDGTAHTVAHSSGERSVSDFSARPA